MFDKNIASKDIEEWREVREIIVDLIVNSDDKELKVKILKVYDFINKSRVYNFG